MISLEIISPLVVQGVGGRLEYVAPVLLPADDAAAPCMKCKKATSAVLTCISTFLLKNKLTYVHLQIQQVVQIDIGWQNPCPNQPSFRLQCSCSQTTK